MDLFQNPIYLLWTALFLIGAWVLAAWSDARRSKFLSAFGRLSTLSRLYPEETIERRRFKFLLQAAAIALFFLALAGPQWGVELVTNESLGIQALVAVDTSRSMLTEDIKPSRIEKAKSVLQQILDGLRGQRVGIIAFAGKAQVQCPLTTDTDAAKTFLNYVRVGMIPQPGTAIAEAIDLGTRMLAKYPGQKAMALLTDGEDRRGHALEAAKAAAEQGVHLYIIGIGTPEGEPIPIKDAQGKVVEYLKDKNGSTVVSKLEESGSIALAKASGGVYYRTTPGETEAQAILNQILSLEKSRMQSGSMNRYKNRYRLPLALGLLLLFIELLLPERRRRENETMLGYFFPSPYPLPQREGLKNAASLPGGDLAKRSTTSRMVPAAHIGGREDQGEGVKIWTKVKKRLRQLTPAIAFLSFFSSGCGSTRSSADLWKGNRDYRKESFDKALGNYMDAMKKNPRDSKPLFNAGDAKYKMGQFDEAKEAFSAVTDPKKVPPGVAPKAFYNLGNAHFKKGEYKEAAEAYKQCLLLDPNDDDCRFNLVKVLQLLKNPQAKKQQDQKNKEQQKQQQQQNSGGQNKEDKKNPEKPAPPRPQSGLSKEDAERILQAVRERGKNLPQPKPAWQKDQKPQEEVDW